MNAKAAIRAEGERLLAGFLQAGAVLVDADVLQPAETLLDLYGEDIRARAYVTQDPVRGEMMLRPDFTVPVVQAHMAHGADPARYAYLGEVFRKQARGSGRASEYLQVGYEVFDRAAPDAADAEVFALFRDLLAGLNLRPVIGDIGILMAAVRGLETSERRKAALLRHVWRPKRFRALLDRFAGRAPAHAGRVALLDRLKAGSPAQLIEQAGTFVGLRSADEIVARAQTLVADAEMPPIKATEAALLYDLLGLEAPAGHALRHLRGITAMLPAIGPAVDRFAARLEALASRGVDVETLAFEASHGRTALEYYDGFVFSFLADGMPPVASGGRYDALTAVLGSGAFIPAVGGVIRPGLVAGLKGATA
ncbi:ATP phosphoribosyltransferase regulatory subunit [Tabrizicola sp.]|jgi:ATP phosphoribosyltransferase regulatory subunit|uniref:ATP phosphoribosyltransferase regulatory subunit n=1 Tax=Tabrizicola sp. TaxID=2005166 RepID=UPI000BC90CB0|nr:ATP phosphoribosyltransferase regulatory subunit [Tabrizicola sp.]MBY0349395.1 ATP phosphoribosyltransferase regulatory subunit [Tabrizicola sp.]OYX19906.1 MAG: ATP phosphoribosyltransferase regulatory subunit [Rhodobacterales bacterium 32-66-9]